LSVYWKIILENSTALIRRIKMQAFLNLLLFLSLFTSLSCGGPDNNSQPNKPKDFTEPLINVNKQLVASEDQRIDDFIARYKWKMHTTGTGLRYYVYKNGTGPAPEAGDIARMHYSVVLLNGDTLYTSCERGIKEFMIGQGAVESGLEEGILFLKKGDRAKLILPSHLAFGLVGDSDKIPAKAALVYDIELIDLIKN
jgi:FKBP-type peptidyl-prolyl cis-trans isomerase FkpA